MDKNFIRSANGTWSLHASINTRSLNESQLMSLLKMLVVCICKDKNLTGLYNQADHWQELVKTSQVLRIQIYHCNPIPAIDKTR